MAHSPSQQTIGSLFRGKGVADRMVLVLSTWFFLGFIPGAPGTYGTMGALIPCLLLSLIAPMPRLGLVVLIIVFSILVSQRAAVLFGKNDPSQVVIDEVAGFLVATAPFPASWINVVIGFIFFRLFDILKPFPINLIDQHLEGGLGIVADDLMAGLYALVCVKIVNYLFL